MRQTLKILACGIAALFTAACETHETTRPVVLTSPAADKVQAALARWPLAAQGSSIKRPFFATIHAAGQRVTASGVLEYYGPRDFRITAATEMGVILFDARMNWAGVTVLRQMPGLDKMIVETMVGDLALAFDMPEDLKGLGESDRGMVLQRKAGDTRKHTWTFAMDTGRLLETDVEMGTFDTLKVEYKGYTAFGWPEELVATRKARLYTISFTFTDNNVVQSNWHGNSQ